MRRLVLCLLLAALVVGSAAAPATAQSKVRRDTVGDVPSFYDVTSVTVRNRSAAHVVTLRFDQVRHGRTIAFAAISAERDLDLDAVVTDRTDRPYYGVVSIPIARGRWRTELYEISDAGGDRLVPCAGLRTRWRRGADGFARLRVPQGCMPLASGTKVTVPFAADKQVALRTAGAERRGDVVVGPSDDLRDIYDVVSPIRTRRG